MRKPFTGFSKDAQEALQQAEWKENIRELKNSIEYGCLNGRPPLVTAEYLFSRSPAAPFTGELGGLNMQRIRLNGHISGQYWKKPAVIKRRQLQYWKFNEHIFHG